jgi:PAS domain S-box-containing protein
VSNPLRVLIIEDSEDDALLILRELRRGGYEPAYERVETAETFETALKSGPWDIIISDYILPKFSGSAALTIFKESGLDLPFIIVSGNIGEDIAVEAMKAGARDYIIKGNLTRLVQAVVRELREAELRHERRAAQRRLDEQQRHLDAFFRHSVTPVVFLDRNFNFIRVNEAYASTCGRTVSDFEGCNHFDMYPSEELKGEFERVIASKKPYSVSARPFNFPNHPEWGVSYWDLNVAPILDIAGAVDFLVFSLQDVTEQKKADDSIVRLNSLYAVLSKVNESIVRIRTVEKLYQKVCRIVVEEGFFKMAWIGITDPESREVKPVAQWGDTGGYLDTLRIVAADVPEGRGPTGMSVFNNRFFMCSDIENDPLMLPWRDKALAHGFRSSAAFPLRSGTEVTGALTVYSTTPQSFTFKEIALMSSLSEDISYAVDSINSEKKRLEAEQALQRSAEEIRDLYNNAPCGYHSLDGRGVIVRINDTELNWLGYSREEVIGKKRFADFMLPESLIVFNEVFPKFKEQGWISDVEFNLVRKDGTILPVLLSATAIQDNDGNFLMSRTTVYDVTDRKEAERRVKSTNELLKLFSQSFTRNEYLDELVALFQKWCGYDCAGIRLIDEAGNVPYCSFTGFSQDFWEKENLLSIGKDSCVCTRIISENPDPAEATFITPGGSFLCNDTSALTVGAKDSPALYRGTCVKQGFSSLAVIPIRYREKVLGAIQLADRSRENFPLPEIEFIESLAPLIGEAVYRFSIEESLFASREQLRNLSAHLLAAREEERIKIARDIHDELAQLLTATSMDLSRIRGKEKLSAQGSERLDSASQQLDTAVQEIQRICSELRPRILDHIGLNAAIEWQSKNFSGKTGIDCHLQLNDNVGKLPDNISTTLFRIFQEGLTNIARHSGATRVEVSLQVQDGSLVLTITDNGKGVTTQQLFGINSFGVLGIRERANDLGGTATFRGVKNRGTTIKVTIPMFSGGTHV